jgi:hypothetical protein
MPTTTTKEGDIVLLPCPFCGDQPRSYWQSASIDEDCGYWAIECCIAFSHDDDEPTAARAWNTREALSTIESDVVRENERLREALKPFAAKADYADALEAEDADYLDCAPFTARDYREARAALSTNTDEKGD